MELFDYQITGANFLAGRRRGLLFDAPGLGKTAQGIRAADQVGAKSLETVCPASVVTQWRKAHEDISETDICFRSRSYESAREDGLSSRPEVVVLDEVHYLKNPDSLRTQAILGDSFYGCGGAIRDAEYVWALSGTPCPHNPADLYQIMYTMVPGSLRTVSGRIMDYDSFINKFCDFYQGDYGRVFKGGKNLAELADRLAPYMLRRTKSEIGKSEPVFGELWLDAGAAGAALRKAELEPEARAVAEVFAKEGFDGLKAFAKTETTGVARYRRYVGMLKILPVVDWMEDQKNSGMEKLVCFAYHREVMAGIQEKLAERGLESMLYQGGMTEKQKNAAKQEFIDNEKAFAFIGQIEASGTGLDGLQHVASDVVVAEPSWINDVNYQAVCRVDREGQKNTVTGHLVGLEGSLDGAIMAAARRRASENKALFN